MGLFRRKSRDTEPKRHELVDIPLGSMIELSDSITFEMSDAASRTFELTERKKYEGGSLLRYMYRLEDEDDVVVLGVDRVGGTNEHEISRWIIDGEEELTEDLPDTITLHYPDPDDEDSEILVEYVRQEIVPAEMTVVNLLEMETFEAELHEYTSEDDEMMSVELVGNWLTFYVGESISLSDVNIYLAEDDEEEYM